MVAVGLSPRIAAKHRIQRRGATPERLMAQPRVGSGVATRRGSVLPAVRGLKPAEAHGYCQLPLCGTRCCATCPLPWKMTTLAPALEQAETDMVEAVLQQGMRSAEHAEAVTALRVIEAEIDQCRRALKAAEKNWQKANAAAKNCGRGP